MVAEAARSTRELKKQYPPRIVDRFGGVIPTANGSIKSHDGGYGTVDFFCGFFFVCLYISCWISTDIDAINLSK